MLSFVRTILTTAAVCLIVFSSGAQGRTFYLATDGNDDAEAVHGAEFATLRTAINNLWYGDTLIIRNGFYQGGVALTTTNGEVETETEQRLASANISEANTEPNFLIDAQIVLVPPPQKRSTDLLSLQVRSSSPNHREEDQV